MGLKENIKELRREKKITLEELSQKVGVSRQTVQRYESGAISNVPSDKIELMAKALDTTPAGLMGWEENSDIEDLGTDDVARQKNIKKLANLSSKQLDLLLKLINVFEDD